MKKSRIEHEEYNISSNEFYVQKDDYDLGMKEFNMVSENFFSLEFGSQPQSEFNEYVQQVNIKPKKSKFKKMMQYLVAGAVIIVSTTGLTVSDNNLDIPPYTQNDDLEMGDNIEDNYEIIQEDIYIPLEYETYTVPLKTGNNTKHYNIYVDESMIDDYYRYLAEIYYKIVIYCPDDFLDTYDVTGKKQGKYRLYFMHPFFEDKLESLVFSNMSPIRTMEVGSSIHYASKIENSHRFRGTANISYKGEVICTFEYILKNYRGKSEEEIYEIIKSEFSNREYEYISPGNCLSCDLLNEKGYIKNGGYEIIYYHDYGVNNGEIDWDDYEINEGYFDITENLEIILPIFIKIDEVN